MGQVTETTIKMIEEHAARGEHAPLTVWELRQLAHAWRKANSLQLADVARTMPADFLSLPSGATCLGTYRNVDDGATYTWGRCDDGFFRLDQFGWATWPTQEGFSRALMLAAAPQAPAAPSGRYELADDGAHQYLDGIEARYSIEREDGTTLAWVNGDKAAAEELMAALRLPMPISRSEWIAEVRSFLCQGGWDEDVALSTARDLCEAQDWLGQDIEEPRDAAWDAFREDIAAQARRAAPAAPAVDAKGEREFWAVLAPCGEGVIFKHEKDARWTLTGEGAGHGGFGVPTIGESFRDCYEDDELELVRVRVAAQAAAKGSA